MFVRLIFVVVSLRRKFFHAELFPNYGRSVIMYKLIILKAEDPCVYLDWVEQIKGSICTL